MQVCRPVWWLRHFNSGRRHLLCLLSTVSVVGGNRPDRLCFGLVHEGGDLLLSFEAKRSDVMVLLL